MSCATGTCARAPDLCDVCRWLTFRIVGCEVQLEAGRCRFVAGHQPPCKPYGKTERAQ